MDIFGIGTDIVECLRIGRMIEQHGELFLTRVYTSAEIRACQARRRTTEYFAAVWAGKEAVLKALGSTWKRGFSTTDIEIRIEPVLRPEVLLLGAARELADNQGVNRVQISMAHCRAYATAYALAFRGPSSSSG